jgi:uncharacterized protein (TIGR00106 family)
MIICQLSIAPVGTDVHLHSYVKKVIQVIEKHKINYETNDMATIIEADNLDIIFDIVKESHERLFNEGVVRLITEIKIDDRKDKNVRLGNKKNLVQLK